MKKLISVLLVLFMLFMNFSIIASAENDEIQDFLCIQNGQSYTALAVKKGAATLSYSDDNIVTAVYDFASGKINITADNIGNTDIILNYDGGSVYRLHTVVTKNKLSVSKTYEIGLGETVKTDTGFNNKNGIIYYVSNQNAEVSAFGKVTGKHLGTATILAENGDGEYKLFSVKVKSAPYYIKLNKTKITLGVNETYKLKYELSNDSASNVEWKSSNTSAVSINNGVITALKPGTSTITALTFNGICAMCEVTVKKEPTSLSLSTTSLYLYKGETYKFSYKLNSGAYSYKRVFISTDNSVLASDSTTMTVKALKEGRSDVYLTLYNGKSVKCKVKVVAKPTKVTLSKTSAKIYMDSSFKLTPNVDNGQGRVTYKFSSSSSSIATVSSTGVVTGKKAGTATITVSTDNGKKATCKVTVVAPTKVTLNSSKLTLGVKETYTLKAKANINPNGTKYKFSSSDSSVATVSSKGVITAKKTGTAKIYCTITNGVKTYCKVTVKKAPSKVYITPSSDFVKVGSSTTVKVKYNSDAYAKKIYYSTSDSKIATVSTSGKVTFKNAGTVKITVKTYNGKTASCNITSRYVDYTTAYTSYNQLKKDICNLGDNYPDLVKVYTIGKSAMGQDITMLTLGKGSKKGLVVGGIHAREHISVTFTMRCVEEYIRAYYSKTGKYGNYNMKQLLTNYTLYVVPCCNPDGIDIVNGKIPLFSNQKQTPDIFKRNARGVNLNRNFPFVWDQISGTTEPNNPQEGYKGDSAGSEPETKALMSLCYSNNFRFMFSMHCMGNNIYWRDSENGYVPNAENIANDLRDNCGYYKSGTSTSPTLYGGGFENWFRYQFDKPGICVELVPSGRGFDFNSTSDYKNFDWVTNYSKTKYTFIQGMIN